MKKLIFASGNKNKIEELNAVFPDIGFEVVSMRSMGYQGDIVEDGDTLEANALIKARFIHNLYKQDCFSEDTGLEVSALDGAPGVHTARYAGELRDANQNMDLLLKNLGQGSDRSARFRTVIALILDGKEFLFEGKVEGAISSEKSGSGGFGYDPIFIPKGYSKTFATLNKEIKNSISHRKRAVVNLTRYLISIK